jgi:ribosomal-protein-alanine N-acetyltransferase
MTKSILIEPSRRRQKEFLTAVERSRKLHGRWVHPPTTPADFDRYIRNCRGSRSRGFWIAADGPDLAGVVTVSEIVRGPFQSAYLGYYAFVPYAGQGYMSRGLGAVITWAFRDEGLHRLEANIQPGNDDSRRLVERLGFALEGFSPGYLKIGGRWRDHERWAIRKENWRTRPEPQGGT